MKIELRPLKAEHLPLLQSWFADAELDRRIAFPTQRYFNYATSEPKNFGRMAYEGNSAVGFVHYSIGPDETAPFAFYVRPDLRNRGYGRRLVRAMLAAPELADVDVIWAGVKPDNIASLRCLASVGFVNMGPDPDEPSHMRLVHDRRLQQKSES